MCFTKLRSMIAEFEQLKDDNPVILTVDNWGNASVSSSQPSKQEQQLAALHTDIAKLLFAIFDTFGGKESYKSSVDHKWLNLHPLLGYANFTAAVLSFGLTVIYKSIVRSNFQVGYHVYTVSAWVRP